MRRSAPLRRSKPRVAIVAKEPKLSCKTCGVGFDTAAGGRPCTKPSPGVEYVDTGRGNHVFVKAYRKQATVSVKFRGIRVGFVGSLLNRVRSDYRCSRDVALSIIVSHGKAFGLFFGERDWPYDADIYAVGTTSLFDVFDFFYGLGFRLLAPHMAPAVESSTFAVAR